jgi:hypothetical protein
MPIPLLSDHPAAAAQEKAMALMLAKLYTALREAGADDDKAREAAEEVASFENRLANVEASLMVLKWMVGFNLILTVAIVGMLFFVLANELAANAAATTDALFNPHPNAAEMPRQSRGKATGAIWR